MDNGWYALVGAAITGVLVKTVEVIVPKRIDAATELRQEYRNDLQILRTEVTLLRNDQFYHRQVILRALERSYRLFGLLETVLNTVGEGFPTYVGRWRTELDTLKKEFQKDCDEIESHESPIASSPTEKETKK